MWGERVEERERLGTGECEGVGRVRKAGRRVRESGKSEKSGAESRRMWGKVWGDESRRAGKVGERRVRESGREWESEKSGAESGRKWRTRGVGGDGV